MLRVGSKLIIFNNNKILFQGLIILPQSLSSLHSVTNQDIKQTEYVIF